MKNSPFRSARKFSPLSVVSALLVILVAALAFVGCGGGGGNEATPSGGEGDHSTTEPTSTGTDTAAVPMTPVAMGEKIYKEKCVLCHGPLGKGDGPGAAALDPKPRNHTDGAYMNARPNAELLDVIKNGKSQMTPWGNILSEEEMRAALTYVRTLAVPAYTGPTP
jgi:mono/diheme cytochrome c family protein